ncbi:MAG: HlyD family efflux transporter periplasmic adaptor subunit [Pseudomonadota bacterium]
MNAPEIGSKRHAAEAMSLADALDRVFAPGRDPEAPFAQRLVGLLAALTNAKSVVAFEDPKADPVARVGQPSDLQPDRTAATLCLAEGRALANAGRLAAPIDQPSGPRLGVSLAMSVGNSMLASLAHERVEMVRKLCTLHVQAANVPAMAEILRHAYAVASGHWGRAQSLVDAIAGITEARSVSLLALRVGRVDRIAIAGQPEISTRSLAKFEAQERLGRALRDPDVEPGLLLLPSAAPTHALVLDGGALPGPIEAALKELFAESSAWASLWQKIWRRLRWALAAAAIAALGALPVTDGVNLPATVTAMSHRIVTAPFDGRLQAIHVREGDRVDAGKTVLATMDTRRMELELAEARGDLRAAITRRDDARGTRNAADLREAEIEAEQASLRLQALSERMVNAEILAPIGGLVLGADLERKAASYIGLGATILEVIDPGVLRIDSGVSPRARARLSAGMVATFRPDAAPTTVVETALETIAVAPEGRGAQVTFLSRSPALMAEDAAQLRPGMQGVTRVVFEDVPLALLVWRRVRDWALLTFWL